MKYLVLTKWKPEANPELRKRMKAWQPEPQTNYILEPHQMIGRCQGCFIVENPDPESMIKSMSGWNDLVKYEVIPIFPSKKAVELTK